MAALAYHVYHQTLIWPLDPFYEEWARPGSSRRDNMMAAVHDQLPGQADLRGPGSTRGWHANTELDPIVGDYRNVAPWRGAITNDGFNYRYLSAAPSLIATIADVTVCEYGGEQATAEPMLHAARSNPVASLDADDHLYAFEGATGSFDGKPPAWSLLGVVLERHVDDGAYDIHIGYRGSQSGDGHRAGLQGMVLERGNPDWVTDMEVFKTRPDARISDQGSVVVGLRDSVVSSFGSLTACLSDISERNGRPPRVVRFCGHSLGAALATQACAAFTVGSFRRTLPASLEQWPWDTAALTTFGAPKAGDAAFATRLSSAVTARRIWADGDPIVEFPLNAHAGLEVPLRTDVTGFANHEVFVTRAAIVSRLRWDQVRGVHERCDHLPWQTFADLGSALAAAAANNDTLSELFPTMSTSAYDRFVELAADVVGEPSSYRVPISKPRVERRRRSRQIRRVLGFRPDSIDAVADHLPRFRGVQPRSTVEEHLRRVFIIGVAVRNGWSAGELLDHALIAEALGTHRRPLPSAGDHQRTVALASGPPPAARDRARVRWIQAMRRVHNATVPGSTEGAYRRRVPPISGRPNLVPACSHYEGLQWLPRQLMVPQTLPAEAQLRTAYKAKYYGLGLLGFRAYERSPINPAVPWDPSFEWNCAFPITRDGWSRPTSDETFVRLRTQGPNPFALRRTETGFEADLSQLTAGVFPPMCARFDLIDGELTPRNISVGAFVHQPGDATWDRAKRAFNAADIRLVPFSRHLLGVHFIVGGAFATSAFGLPPWHPLRPFLHFFTYGTLQVNDFAYRSFFVPSSYFIASGFVDGDAARKLLHNTVASFDLDEWIPTRDIARRGLEGIPGHPYVEDALPAWYTIRASVERYIDALGLDDAAIAPDHHLQAWYLTLTALIPNSDPWAEPLDRRRLVDLCAILIYNNVVHEICGDLSPILGSVEPDDKAIINLENLLGALGDGELTSPLPAPSMADVFLMDQATYASRFNVGGNNLLTITAARWIDEPRLVAAVEELQTDLANLDNTLAHRNSERPVSFDRMRPSNWEASVSF